MQILISIGSLFPEGRAFGTLITSTNKVFRLETIDHAPINIESLDFVPK